MRRHIKIQLLFLVTTIGLLLLLFASYELCHQYIGNFCREFIGAPVGF